MQTAQKCKEIDRIFDRIFNACGPDGEPVPVSLLRVAAKMIVATYPVTQDSELAVTNIISGAKHLRSVGRHN